MEIVKVLLNDKKYFFYTNHLSLQKNMNVIVEGEKGLQYGQVIIDPYEVDNQDLSSNIRNVVRIATIEDDTQYQENINDCKDALIKARQFSKELNLNMRIIDANFTFDRNQLLFNFLADNRIDFRELAKKLAQVYHTRIELRQIGVRDKAKNVGGLGPCGRFLCCSTFLTDFNSVSINMAKNQMLALNPTKINGICGRLLCCLNYEDEVYTEMKNGMPSIGHTYKKDGVDGKVISLNLLKRTAIIETVNKTLEEVEVD